jgi:hypothetical protein
VAEPSCAVEPVGAGEDQCFRRRHVWPDAGCGRSGASQDLGLA